MEKEQNNKVVDKEIFIQQLQKIVLYPTEQNIVPINKISTKETLLHIQHEI